jgi:hypothetical protein
MTIDQVIANSRTRFEEWVARRLEQAEEELLDYGVDPDEVAETVEHERRLMLAGWAAVEADICRYAAALELATHPRWPSPGQETTTSQLH